MNIEIIGDTIADTVKQMNTHRRKNPESWLFFHVTLNGLPFKAKTFGTWTQIMQAPGFRASGGMDGNVTQWQAELTKWFSA